MAMYFTVHKVQDISKERKKIEERCLERKALNNSRNLRCNPALETARLYVQSTLIKI